MSNPYVNCPVNRYHLFNATKSPYLGGLQESSRQVEVCTFCKVEKTYRFNPDGSMANEQDYLMDHIRYFAQPSMGEVYWECNPEAKEKFALEAAGKKQMEEKHAELSDKFKFAIKRALNNEDDGIQKK